MLAPTRKKIDTTHGEITVRPLTRGEFRRFMGVPEDSDSRRNDLAIELVTKCVVDAGFDLDELENGEWNDICREVMELSNTYVRKN